MREYFGNSAKKYKQPSDKYFTLFPALERNLPEAKGVKRLIDLGCGTGDLFEFVESKGYGYVGVDISKDMLDIAKNKHPQGEFILGNASKSIPEVHGLFDVVLSNMLMPSIKSESEFVGVFETAEKLLNHNGLFLMGAMHPCFDGYMQKRLFSRDDIKTNFKGYFHSGENYQVHRMLEGNDFIFIDYHWQLTNYFIAAQKTGLYLEMVDECPLSNDAPSEIADKYNNKGVPNYLVLSLRKLC